MERDGKSQDRGVPKGKTLSLEDGSGSKNAHCISSYGAYMAVSESSPNQVREIFCDTNPAELREIADAVQETIEDFRGEPVPHEGEIKDLAFKRELLLSMADINSDKEVVTPGPEGKFTNPREE